jgi:uncharacterized membrane protein YeiH
MVINVLELVGLYVFATSGALMAIHKGFDVVGIVVLAMLTALGGGILRDLIIGDTPPSAFANANYLIILVQVDTDLYSIPAATCAAVLVFLFRIVAMLRHWTAPRAWTREGR